MVTEGSLLSTSYGSGRVVHTDTLIQSSGQPWRVGTVSIPISQVKKLRLREVYLPTITQEEGTGPHTGIFTLDVLKGQYCGQPVDSSAFFL